MNLWLRIGKLCYFIKEPIRDTQVDITKRKENLKPVLNEDIRTLCDKKTSDSKYLFGENFLESVEYQIF